MPGDRNSELPLPELRVLMCIWLGALVLTGATLTWVDPAYATAIVGLFASVSAILASLTAYKAATLKVIEDRGKEDRDEERARLNAILNVEQRCRGIVLALTPLMRDWHAAVLPITADRLLRAVPEWRLPSADQMQVAWANLRHMPEYVPAVIRAVSLRLEEAGGLQRRIALAIERQADSVGWLKIDLQLKEDFINTIDAARSAAHAAAELLALHTGNLSETPPYDEWKALQADIPPVD